MQPVFHYRGISTQILFNKKDIKDLDHLPYCDAVINFAAESHVDNSI